MKLILDAAASIPADDEGPGLVIESFDPALRPDDDDWMLALLLGGLPTSPPASVQPAQTMTTDRGWPATVIEAHIENGEARLAVFYQFLHYAAAALVRAPNVECMARHREEVMRALLSARPDFTGGEPVAMAELVGKNRQ